MERVQELRIGSSIYQIPPTLSTQIDGHYDVHHHRESSMQKCTTLFFSPVKIPLLNVRFPGAEHRV
jgi:hypothetical protein